MDLSYVCEPVLSVDGSHFHRASLHVAIARIIVDLFIQLGNNQCFFLNSQTEKGLPAEAKRTRFWSN